MKTYYIGIIVEGNEMFPTDVFDTAEECENECLQLTDDYYVVAFDVDVDNMNTLH